MEIKFKMKPQFNNVYITSDSTVEKKSNIALIGQSERAALHDEQTVLAVGPTVHNISPGDRIVLDVDRLMAVQPSGKQVHLRKLLYSKKKGTIITTKNVKEFDIKNDPDLDECILITDREILGILED